MYEVTVIEHAKDGFIFMTHWPFDDDVFDIGVQELIDNENACVAAGSLKCYTLITQYEQFNKASLYFHRPSLAVTSKENK